MTALLDLLWPLATQVKKIGKTPRRRTQGKKCYYPQKILVTRNTHVKAQALNVKESLARLKFQTDLQND